MLIAPISAMIAFTLPTKGGSMAMNSAVLAALVLIALVVIAVMITAAVLLLRSATTRSGRQQDLDDPETRRLIAEATRASRGVVADRIHPESR